MDEGFKKHFQKTSEHNEGGLWMLYRSCLYHYKKALFAVTASVIRGFELFAFVIIYRVTFSGFDASDSDEMIRTLRDAFIEFLVVGILCLGALTGAVSIFGRCGYVTNF